MEVVPVSKEDQTMMVSSVIEVSQKLKMMDDINQVL